MLVVDNRYQAVKPRILSLEGLTGYNLPVKPPDKILVISTLPLPSLLDAPTTDIFEGER
ncbi:MAG: hypothetical protein WAM14_02365 [Candidatus Nitrosopolaris sp.]